MVAPPRQGWIEIVPHHESSAHGDRLDEVPFSYSDPKFANSKELDRLSGMTLHNPTLNDIGSF